MEEVPDAKADSYEATILKGTIDVTYLEDLVEHHPLWLKTFLLRLSGPAILLLEKMSEKFATYTKQHLTRLFWTTLICADFHWKVIEASKRGPDAAIRELIEIRYHKLSAEKLKKAYMQKLVSPKTVFRRCLQKIAATHRQIYVVVKVSHLQTDSPVAAPIVQPFTIVHSHPPWELLPAIVPASDDYVVDATVKDDDDRDFMIVYDTGDRATCDRGDLMGTYDPIASIVNFRFEYVIAFLPYAEDVTEPIATSKFIVLNRRTAQESISLNYIPEDNVVDYVQPPADYIPEYAIEEDRFSLRIVPDERFHCDELPADHIIVGNDVKIVSLGRNLYISYEHFDSNHVDPRLYDYLVQPKLRRQYMAAVARYFKEAEAAAEEEEANNPMLHTAVYRLGNQCDPSQELVIVSRQNNRYSLWNQKYRHPHCIHSFTKNTIKTWIQHQMIPGQQNPCPHCEAMQL